MPKVYGARVLGDTDPEGNIECSSVTDYLLLTEGKKSLSTPQKNFSPAGGRHLV